MVAVATSETAFAIVEKPGVLTTVQDFGRPSLRGRGLPGGGAADTASLRTANLLVGNAEDAAALECALVGPVLHFKSATIVAVTGATVVGIPHCERFRVDADERLMLSRFKRGAYAYVAVAGGIAVPQVLGSRSTDVRLRFGGIDGRALRVGDELSFNVHAMKNNAVSVRVGTPGLTNENAPIRIVDGKDAGRVSSRWVDTVFTISSQSDRAGVRLEGPKLTVAAKADAASSVVLPGTVQLPGSGLPIVLLADAQTLGGYPQIAHVIRADLPRMAQFKPGSTVRFERVTLGMAHQLARRQEREFAFLRYGLQQTIERHAGP